LVTASQIATASVNENQRTDMPAIPSALQNLAVARTITWLRRLYAHRETIEVMSRPALDRAFQVLIHNAEAQGELTAAESVRLLALERRRKRKIKGGRGRYGWTLEERIEVALLLQKAYRDHPQADWILAKVAQLLKAGVGKHRNTGAADSVDGEAVDEPTAPADRVVVPTAEYERLLKLAGEADKPDPAE